jgi:hypothetical protein
MPPGAPLIIKEWRSSHHLIAAWIASKLLHDTAALTVVDIANVTEFIHPSRQAQS